MAWERSPAAGTMAIVVCEDLGRLGATAPNDAARGRRGNVTGAAPTGRRRSETRTGRGLRTDASARLVADDDAGSSTAPHVIPESAESNKIKAHHRLDWRGVKCDSV